MKQETNNSILGMVTSRECPLCGHHEIGFVTQGGEFHPLRPGTIIRVGEPTPPPVSAVHKDPTPVHTEDGEPVTQQVWIPEPLRGDRALRVKFSVMAKAPLAEGAMSGGVYELAYLGKLERLVDKALGMPLPVILDRFFNAPHLSSGNSKEVAEGMYHELEEVRRPVVLMKAWLEKQDDLSLAKLIAPRAVKDLGVERAEDAQVEKELQELTLEQFLEML